MKNPNGYGSIVNLGKSRRKPFGVRVTVGYDDSGKQKYKYISYHENRREAMKALAEFNTSPYDLNLKNTTFKEVADRMMEQARATIQDRTYKGYEMALRHCGNIHNRKMADIRTLDLQNVIDLQSATLSTGTLKLIRTFIGQVFRTAMQFDIISKNYSEFIKMPKHRAVVERNIFTPEEIALLWGSLDAFRYADTVLILIYTGLRINELLKLKKESISLEDMTITGGSKTKAGKNRIIPIHPKIQELVIKRMGNRTEYFIPNVTEKNFMHYTTYLQQHFRPMMDELGMNHTIHDTRHTFATMITDVSSNDAAIKGMMGHSSIDMTKHYTHTDIEKMRREIEKIN